MGLEKTHKKILFVMSIDTEEEWDWNKGFPIEKYSVQNTQNVPKFQAFCNELGVKPTYFIDYAIAADPLSVKHFKEPLERYLCQLERRAQKPYHARDRGNKLCPRCLSVEKI